MLETRYILGVLALPGFGRKTVNQLIQSLKAPPASQEELQQSLASLKDRMHRLRLPTSEQLGHALERADQTLARCSETGIRAYGLNEKDFPSALREISDPPVVLFARGDIRCLANRPAVAVVGTRKPTKLGESTASQFARCCAARGFAVVSGLALGCDAAAHRGCLETKGITVAFLAHGLDKIYPATHDKLAGEIIEAGGCLLSEYPPGAAAQRRSFIERNRLQSGASAGVVVIETDLKGGTMHTVAFCLDQHRQLACFAHPGPLAADLKAAGNQQLIREGKAMPLENEIQLAAFLAKLMPAVVPSAEAGTTSGSDEGQLMLPF